MRPSHVTFLVLIHTVVVSCGSPSGPESGFGDSTEIQACATPADATAPADVVLTVQDATISWAPGVHFQAWTYDGDVPGPVLRLSLGETSRVKLINESPRPASLHFHGVSYAASDDGSPEHPQSMVNPGCAHVYTITADEPGVWPFHSHRNPREEMAKGLYGAVIVPPTDELPADHEYVIFLGQLGLEEEEGDENNARKPDFAMTINGRPYARAEVIELMGDRYVATRDATAMAEVGDRLRWRVLNVSPDEPHTFHLHGHRWCDRDTVMNENGNCPAGSLPVDNVALLPAQGVSLEFVEDNPGTWMYHCHITDHVDDGMFAFYDVNP